RLAGAPLRAGRIAEGGRRVGGRRVLTPSPVTNFVRVDAAPSGRTADDVVADLRRHGVNASSRPPTIIRFVTHRQIDDDDVAVLIKTFEEILRERRVLSERAPPPDPAFTPGRGTAGAGAFSMSAPFSMAPPGPAPPPTP